MAPPADPSSLTVRQRVDLLIADAKETYGVTVAVNQATRTAEQAQQFHVCHMFLYNKFKSLRPKHVAADGRTIAWSHLSDAKVDWVLIDSTQFLVTSTGTPAQREKTSAGTKWKSGQEPDKTKSTAAMSDFLKAHHVTSMAAPGKSGCGEPCACGGGASKHITGKAVDLSGMPQLASALAEGYAGHGDPLDEYLTQFRLYRPMAHLAASVREEWHVEALPASHPIFKRRDHPKRYLRFRCEVRDWFE